MVRRSPPIDRVGGCNSRSEVSSLRKKMVRESGYTSRILYHFVGRKDPKDHERNYQTLLKILDSGAVCYRREDDEPCEDDSWGDIRITVHWDRTFLTQDLIVPTVTCFCDIPFEHLGVHTNKYGQFGLGFDREYLIYYGARPVMYFPYHPKDLSQISACGANLLNDIKQVFKSFEELVVEPTEKQSKQNTGRFVGEPPESPQRAISAMSRIFGKEFVAFIKAFNCTLSTDYPENYYMEREWRKYQDLRFEPQDVRKIVVNKSYVDRLKRDRSIYADKVIECQQTESKTSSRT